jgi:MFS family permease
VFGTGGQLAESLRAVRNVFANENLRRIELAFAGSAVGKYALVVAVSIYTYHADGVTAVAFVTAAQWTAGAAVAPFAASLADRFRRERVMLASDLGRVACTAAIAVSVSQGAPHLVVYVLAVGAQIFAAVFRPAEAALVALVARSPQELTAANVASSTFDSVGVFAGPALGASLIAVSGYATSFALVAATFAWSALNVVRISSAALREAAARQSAVAADEGAAEGHGLESIVAGFRTIRHEPRLRLLIGLYSAQCFAAGALNVLLVALALGLLHTGNAGVGLLQSACGVGAIAGAGLALGLIARSRLGSDFTLGLVLWGAPLLLVGAFPHVWTAAVALAVLGAGNSVVDIAAVTLIQRTAREEVAARVFGVLESALIVALAAGALVTPLLVHGIGIRSTLFAVGALLPALAVLTARGLASIDRGAHVPTEQIAALRRVPFLAMLPAQSLERLALRLRRVELQAGATLFARGDHADSFFMLESGQLAIELDGAVKVEEAPGFVGEIALLRSVPRTATVRAASDVKLWALDRDDFLDAVTGHAWASSRADSVVVARLGAASPA